MVSTHRHSTRAERSHRPAQDPPHPLARAAAGLAAAFAAVLTGVQLCGAIGFVFDPGAREFADLSPLAGYLILDLLSAAALAVAAAGWGRFAAGRPSLWFVALCSFPIGIALTLASWWVWLVNFSG
jgi:hypothetical protein